mmetsp:Transcript_61737/g.121244  ORF Transcript_61737/g.121244 Transcript_61737/m.121244 type:complete len:206 (-) Transcript_61737:455-1072(-)
MPRSLSSFGICTFSSSTTRASWHSSSGSYQSVMPSSSATTAKSGTTAATLYGLPDPYSTAWFTNLLMVSAFSMGAGATYLPFSSLYCSLLRPVTLMCFSPGPTMVTKSPVRNQRSPLTGSTTITSAVASGLPQYPAITCGPLTHSSPSDPALTSTPIELKFASSKLPGSTTRSLLSGTAGPQVPSTRSLGSGCVMDTTGLVSVKP